jgi:response regulator RpfG family c-di-GMP phosphodiesterase
MQIKLLIVDDDLEVVTMIGKTFTTMLQGYLVLTATSANAGMGMLKEQRPDVVILDVRLGPKSGMDLLEDFYGYLKSSRAHYYPRFIVITAYPDDAVRKQALEQYKVDAFLMKPFAEAEIKEKTVESILKILETEHRNLSALVGKPEKDLNEKRGLVEKKIQEGLREAKESS